MNNPFKVGDKVKTTDQYFEMFGRKVHGFVPKHTLATQYKNFVLVFWMHQEGEVNPKNENEIVMMNVNFLELDA